MITQDGAGRARALFRKEAVLGAQRSQAGEPSAACGLSLSVLCVVALGLAGALLVFACTTEYTRKARVKGFIEPTAGLIKVRASTNGRVSTVHVRDGTNVRQGEPLMLISTDHASEGDGAARTAIVENLNASRKRLEDEVAAQTRIDELAASDRVGRVSDLEGELAQLEREVDLQRQRVATAKTALQRMRGLTAKGHVAAAAADQPKAAWLDRRSELESLRRARLRVVRERDALLADSRRGRLDDSNRRSRLRRELDAVDRQIAEQHARMSVLVTAPADGTVSGLLVREGQRAQEDAPLLTLVPAGTRLEATLLVPSHAAGFIRPEQSVRVRYAAFPHQRFGSHHGEIGTVSETLLLPGEKELPVQLEQPAYTARVTLGSQIVVAYGRELPLKAGMQLEADVALDRRRIIEWLLEPVLSLRGRLWPEIAS